MREGKLPARKIKIDRTRNLPRREGVDRLIYICGWYAEGFECVAGFPTDLTCAQTFDPELELTVFLKIFFIPFDVVELFPFIQKLVDAVDLNLGASQ